MAVSLKRPIVVPAADAGATVIYDKAIKVSTIHWVSAAAGVGDVAEIQAPDGNVLWSAIAPGPFFDSGLQEIDHWWNTGFKVPTLDSGTLYIDYD